MTRYLLPGVKPHVQAAADEVGTRFGIATILGVGARPNASDHPKGLALDYMVTGPRGTQLRDYVKANAARLGVTYIIWQQTIWSKDRAAEGNRPMSDRGSVTANHYDHVHVSFSPTAGTGGSPTMPGINVPIINADPARVRALIDPLPWFGKGLGDRVDEATAGLVKAATGLAVAGVLVAGGVALVVAGLIRTAHTRKESSE